MKISWKEVTSDPLLSRCHAACVTHEGRVYIHGGLLSLKQSGQPLSSLVCWDPEANTVNKVETGGEAVTRSHHTANLSGDVMILTGGWDGKNRTSEVSAFNLKTRKWLNLRHLEELSRPPFGLSGHSCTMIRSSLFCVLGREGGLKIQRRFGDIFLLHINIDTDNHVGTYYWKEAPVKTKSRSGHTALLAPSLRFGGDLYGLFVFGGRDDESVHKCGQWKAEEVEVQSVQAVDNEELYRDIGTITRDLVPDKPVALRYHSMLSINKRCVIVIGGENFRSRNNISGRMQVCLFREGAAHWHSLDTGEGRAAACAVSLASGVFIISGRNEKRVLSSICRLTINKD